jgi:predicted phosphohydrolase
MNIWGISDLHLSFAQPDRRERFGARWRDHAAKIEQNWLEVVRPGDLVLIPGDLSMARNHRDLQADLQWLDRLPGVKILSRGNHDRWWNDLASIRRVLRRSQLAVDGVALRTPTAIVCGSLGSAWLRDNPSSSQPEAADSEFESFSQALLEAKQLRGTSSIPLYVLCHFPPFDAYARPAPWVGLFEDARVTACVYGHLHIESQWALAVQGTVRGVRYYCVAADAIGFRPLRIDSLANRPIRRNS